MNRYDAIVVGAGANGLATAALLAQKGRKVLVLERREVAGGTSATEEFHPGYRVSACRDDVGWVPESLVRQLQLARHGLQWLQPPAGLVGIGAETPPVVRSTDGKPCRRPTPRAGDRSPLSSTAWRASCRRCTRCARRGCSRRR